MKISLLYFLGFMVGLLLNVDINKTLNESTIDKSETTDYNITECINDNVFPNEYLLKDFSSSKTTTDLIKITTDLKLNLCWEGGDGSDSCHYVGGCSGGNAFCGGLCETQGDCTFCHICTLPIPSPIEN